MVRKPEEVRLATGAGWNVEARRLRDAAVVPVVPIEAALGRSDRPAPALAGYDQLLVGAHRAQRRRGRRHRAHDRTLLMTATTVLSDDAAAAAIDAARKAPHLPTVRAEAGPMADAATRDRITHRGYLADRDRERVQPVMRSVVKATLAERRRQAARHRWIVAARGHVQHGRAGPRGVRASDGLRSPSGSAIGQAGGATHATPRIARWSADAEPARRGPRRAHGKGDPGMVHTFTDQRSTDWAPNCSLQPRHEYTADFHVPPHRPSWRASE